jgi:hypothetical protein
MFDALHECGKKYVNPRFITLCYRIEFKETRRMTHLGLTLVSLLLLSLFRFPSSLSPGRANCQWLTTGRQQYEGLKSSNRALHYLAIVFDATHCADVSARNVFFFHALPTRTRGHGTRKIVTIRATRLDVRFRAAIFTSPLAMQSLHQVNRHRQLL